MSLEQSFTSKLTLETRKSSGALSVTSSSSQNPPEKTPSPSPKPALGKIPSFTFKRDKSPLRQLQQLERVDSVDTEGQIPQQQQQSSHHLTSPNHHSSPTHTVSVDRAQSVRLTRKILHNWKSACGSKTKDLFRRWKTLPEDHPDFDSLSASNNSYSEPRRGSTKSNIPGSTSATHVEGASGAFGRPKSATTGRKHCGESDFSGLNNSWGGKRGTGESSVNGKTGGWSVHVWTTYVRRGSGEADGLSDNDETPPPRDALTEFQKVKLTYFFHQVMDSNKDGLLTISDFNALNQRVRHYIEWSDDSIEFYILKEVHSGFLECFLNQLPTGDNSFQSTDKEPRDAVNVEEWLDIWAGLLEGTRNIESLPLWLRYFTKILFQVINKTGSGTITREQLRAFYTMFLGIDFRIVNETLDSIFSAMTDGSRSPLDYNTFRLCFANFLFGRYPHGPGQYLFGICSPGSLNCPFPIDYSALNTPVSDLQPYDPDRDKRQNNRRSVIV